MKSNFQNIFLLLVLFLSGPLFGMDTNQPTYMPGVFYAKLKPEFRQEMTSEKWQKVYQKKEGLLDIQPLFPYHRELKVTNGLVDLSLMYVIEVSSSIESQVIQDLQESEMWEYIEPKKIHELTFMPSDPDAAGQVYLYTVNAFSAYDFTQGSTNVKIGIVDSGTQMDHEDLETELALNLSDPINGIDDDGDGYVDNYYGWDFIDNDNFPETDASPHGIHVSGTAAAATNNGTGVASIGFLSQYLPIRAANGSSVLYGYEGIVYAADMGCDVINCSWGSFGYSKFEEDIINYATFNKGVLVVGAAGNKDRDEPFYPAAYENCFAVASVGGTNQKSSFSNYGTWVDIVSPGESVYSTFKDNGYNFNTGTSMASPMVAGAAALVKAQYPQLSPKQIMARIKSTATVRTDSNPAYMNKLGSGMLNVSAAVDGMILQPMVEFENVQITNGYDGILKTGDTVYISGTFTNYLGEAENVVATINSGSPYIVLGNITADLGSMPTAMQKNNYDDPFTLKVLNTAPVNEKIAIILNISDGFSNTPYLLEIVVNEDFLNNTTSEISFSVGSKGQIGYNTTNKNQGVGFTFQDGVSQLYEAGLMIGAKPNGYAQVVDGIRNSPSNYDQDFTVFQQIKELTPAPEGSFYATGEFTDAAAGFDSLGVSVGFTTYNYDEPGHEYYGVVEYTVRNESSTDLTDLAIGLFADLDVLNYFRNRVSTDWLRMMTYAESTEENVPVFGVQLLTPGTFRSYGIDIVSGGDGGVDITSNYTTIQKYQTLTTNRYSAGVADANGNDVAQVTSIAQLSVPSGDSVTVAFALHAAPNVYLLQKSADSAYFRYNGAPPNSIKTPSESDVEINVYPNPTQSLQTISVSESVVNEGWRFSVRNNLGQLVFSSGIVNDNHTIWDAGHLSSGIYFIEIQINSTRKVVKFSKID